MKLDFLKGKEKLVGMAVVIVLTAIAGMIGLNSESLKDGLCDRQSQQQSDSHPDVLIKTQDGAGGK